MEPEDLLESGIEVMRAVLRELPEDAWEGYAAEEWIESARRKVRDLRIGRARQLLGIA